MMKPLSNILYTAVVKQCVKVHGPLVSYLYPITLQGLWWGYVIGLGIQDLCLFGFMLSVDWQMEADKVRGSVSIVPVC